jgi:hypothetical protein
MTDLKRLGKRGSYRLGRLRAQGVTDVGPPALLRPRFRRVRHRGPTWAWLLAAAAGAAVIAAGAAAGLWFAPFAAGLAAGLANRAGGWRARVLSVAVALMAASGWGLPLWWLARRGEPAGATARVIAALLGLPPHAVVGVTVTLLVAVLQGLAGLWLGRALTPMLPDAGLGGPGGLGAAGRTDDWLQFRAIRRRLGWAGEVPPDLPAGPGEPGEPGDGEPDEAEVPVRVLPSRGTGPSA